MIASTWHWTASDTLVALLLLAACTAFRPLRPLVRYAVSLAAGGASLWLLNVVGEPLHLHLPLNPVTAVCAAGLGVPGVVALAVLQAVWGRI